MKFIHTSDWQLGIAFKRIPLKAEALRKARIDAVKQIVALAEREKVDFIIAAGDLFDDNRLFPKEVEEMAAAVSRCPVPVYLLPGNHDPLNQDSPYSRCPGLFKGSAVVLDKQEPVQVPGGALLYPCPLRTKHSRQDPTSWIPERVEGDPIRVGVAHGSVYTPSPDDFPIAANTAIVKGLDYLALGHWHSAKSIDDRTWYCGAPEATGFGEPNAGKVLLVEICAPGTKPKVREVDVAYFNWKEVEREVHSEAEVELLLKDLELLASPKLILRLRVKGSLPQPVLDKIEAYETERFFHLQKEIDVVLEKGSWEYKHAILRGMAEALSAATAQGANEKDAQVARKALSKLNFLVKHSGFRNEGT